MRVKSLASTLAAAIVGGLASPASATTYAQYTATYLGAATLEVCTIGPCTTTQGSITATVVFTAQSTEMYGYNLWVAPYATQSVYIQSGEGVTLIKPTGASIDSNTYFINYTANFTVDPASVGDGPLPYFDTANLTGGTYHYNLSVPSSPSMVADARIFSVSTLFSDRPFSTPLGATNFVSNISPAPEPATWAMMLVGFGVAGAALRRRSKVRHTVSFA